METVAPYLLVFVGAGLGGALRLASNISLARVLGADATWATAIINVSGSLAMGLLFGWFAYKPGSEWTHTIRLFVGTGVLGGYTTFSTFSLDAILLIERNEIGQALTYVVASVVLGVVGLWAGIIFARSLA